MRGVVTWITGGVSVQGGRKVLQSTVRKSSTALDVCTWHIHGTIPYFVLYGREYMLHIHTIPYGTALYWPVLVGLEQAYAVAAAEGPSPACHWPQMGPFAAGLACGWLGAWLVACCALFFR